MPKQYPLFDIYWDEDDIESVTKLIKRGSYWAIGPEIREFETKLENYFSCKHAITFNSGTSALHASLLSYGITSGEVIVPSMSFVSTANAVVLAGAKPIFAEIEGETLGLDIEDVQKKITSKTKAIIPMHYGGKTCKNIKQIQEIAKNGNLKVIEDNAESFGAKLDDKFAGCFGDSGMLSFCQNKIITTGEGGAILTNDEEVYKKLQLIRSHGRVETVNVNYFENIHPEDYIEVGYNYRMPSMNAALGISQLKKIDKIISLRRKVGKLYDELLKSISNVRIIPELSTNFDVYQLYTLYLEDPKIREKLQNYLVKHGIYTKIYFAPIHLKSFYRQKWGHKEGDLPITEDLSSKVLTLPISLRFDESDQTYIVNLIKTFFK